MLNRVIKEKPISLTIYIFWTKLQNLFGEMDEEHRSVIGLLGAIDQRLSSSTDSGESLSSDDNHEDDIVKKETYFGRA